MTRRTVKKVGQLICARELAWLGTLDQITGGCATASLTTVSRAIRRFRTLGDSVSGADRNIDRICWWVLGCTT